MCVCAALQRLGLGGGCAQARVGDHLPAHCSQQASGPAGVQQGSQPGWHHCGKVKENIDEAKVKKKGKVLKRVKHKEQQDNEAGGHEMNPRINQLSVQLKVKKAHCG